MFLKSLELQGFKSFPDKTKVNFGNGLTAVVGPNGSGKSNISDAVRWVLGEQSTKTLRGDKMEDVIFSGTQERKAQGFAEVSLTLDNKDRSLAIDTDEVMITRRYDRSGDSDYMINRSPVRLKDITELLMDTGLSRDGYFQVGQGKIEEIVTSKPTERREIFEEAAGISKYRYHKVEAERNLEKAEDNLSRLRDILSELEVRIDPLREQSEKAKKYLDLAEKRKSLEVSIAIDTISKSNMSLKDQSDKLVVAQNSYAEIESEIELIEADIQDMFEKRRELSVEMDELRRERRELDNAIAEINSEIAVCKNDILHNEQSIERLKAELLQNSGNFAAFDSELAEKENDKAALEEKLSMLEGKISEKEQALLAGSSETDGFTKRENELNDRINELLLKESETKMRIAAAKITVEEYDSVFPALSKEMEEKQAEAEKSRAELERVEGFITTLSQKEESIKNALSGRQIKLENRTQKLSALKSDCEKIDLSIKEKEQKATLLSAMEQALDGYQYSVREVIKKAKNGVLSGIKGTVSQIISVDEEYSLAIETALGAAMQNIVTDSENSAKSAIRHLKENNLGRATFLPITSVKGNVLSETGLESYAGFIDKAVNLVGFSEEYRPVMNYLLGRIAIVDDIDTAVTIARKYGYKFRLVTLDGQVVNAGGSLTGGSHNKNNNLLSRKNDIAAIQSEVKQLKEKYQSSLAEAQRLKEETAKMEAEVNAANSELRTVSEDMIRAEGELERIKLQSEQSNDLIKRMQDELHTRSDKYEESKHIFSTGESTVESIVKEAEALKAELSSIQSTGKEKTENNIRMGSELSEMKIEKVTVEKDIAAICSAIELIKERKAGAGSREQSLNEQQEELALANAEIQKHIDELLAGIEESKRKSAESEENIEKALNQSNEYERLATEKRTHEREVSARKENIAADMVRIEERKDQIQKQYDNMIAHLWDEYELTRSEAEKIALPLENVQKSNSELNSIRNKIRALGSVNVDAIEEYKEVGERYEFLKEQIADSEKSKSELTRLISELTAKMEDIFAVNFAKINANFSVIFAELFGGGRGELRITDPENLLESGVEIYAEPPGKTVKNLSALSGGEKALIAISIYFAIFKIRPAPFCVLDEIEAALDDVNVDKYAAYLKNLTDKTQFIAITHRRGTMNSADILYGVTMQNSGVSKLLQLNVSELESKLGVTDSR